MNKLLNNLKKQKYLLITFFISIIVICVIYKLQSVIPFGKNSLLTIDFFHQYGPMLAELYDRIYQGENLIYSFNIGLGIPFFRNFFNYLSSPINLIMLLFKRENILISYSTIIALKASLSACTMVYYLKNKFKKINYGHIGISVLYAYSSYFTAYYWNIMWLDGMFMLPIITLGIENLINKKNGVLYTLSLAMMLYINYFIGYMICIFSTIYFIAYLFETKKNYKDIIETILKFSMCSLISGMLMAWQLIPMFEALLSTNATSGTMPTSQYYSFTIIEFLQNQITGVTPTVLASGITNSPNTSCGILSIGLYILFLINKKINKKTKVVIISLLTILLLSFYIAPLDYIWHAFHVPNDLPYRYSFIYSFILMIAGAYALKNINNIPYKKVFITLIICIIYLSIIKIAKFPNITNKMITINYILITTYFLIYTLYHFYPKYKKTSITIFLLVISLECIISINHNWDISQNAKEFYSTYQDINNSIKKINKTDKELFYRTEKDKILTLNDGAWYDYNGISTFSSMAYNNMATFINNLGQPGNKINSYYYKQNTPIFDLLFNIKYSIGENNDTKRYSNILNENGIKTYKFNYSNGLMYGVNKSTKNWEYNYINPFEFQNDFIKHSTNIEKTLYRLTLNDKKIIKQTENETIIKFKYFNEYDNIYIYANNSLIDYIIYNNTIYYKNTVNLDDIKLNTNINFYNYETYDEEYIINTISNEKYLEIIVGFSTYLNEEIDVYTINQDKFVKAYNYLKSNKINITKFKDNYIEGNINSNKDMSIYTSIPYDKGWKVYINNKRIDTYKINEALLGFDLPKGKNKIILKYSINNIDIGIAISISTIIFSITYLIIKKRKKSI